MGDSDNYLIGTSIAALAFLGVFVYNNSQTPPASQVAPKPATSSITEPTTTPTYQPPESTYEPTYTEESYEEEPEYEEEYEYEAPTYEYNDAGCPKNQWVNGYTRSDGTYVNGYYRNSPSDNCQ